MNRTIVIVGGGISGLSLLYFLNKKYDQRSDVRIVLLEKNAYAGGNIRTILQDGVLFECGPNGFLANQPAMLDLIGELGLNEQLIAADASAKRRYIVVKNELHQVPTSLSGLFRFKPMTLRQKFRIFAEPFIVKGNDPDESFHHFMARRFGTAVAQILVDPMVSGIYGGRSDHLSVRSAFPKLYEHEQTCGSVIKGIMSSRKKGGLKGELKSFKEGMGTLIKALIAAAGESLHVGEGVKEIINASPYSLVVTDQEKYAADELYLCAPAYAAGQLLEKFDHDLGNALKSVEYAPIAVIGLAFKREAFGRLPDGFGYLIPSSEKKSILGVLIESNIFSQRAGADAVMIRVMIGGIWHPECAGWTEERLVTMALEEIKERFSVTSDPVVQKVIRYDRAIPQYELQDLKLKARISTRLAQFKNIYLCSNYWNGVSMNDCVKNAKETADRSSC